MIDFPASPINGQVFTSGAQSWTFDGTKWVASGVAVQPPLSTGDNRIINGDMRIDQRNGGASGTATGYTVDRWAYAGSVAAKGTWQRQPASLASFPYQLLFVSSSAYAVVAADYFLFQQTIEADMISDFAWGTASAQPVTLSFWVASSLTGTFGGSVQNYNNTRSYPFSFSLPTASAWTKIVITIPGDTTGAWVMSGNAGSVVVSFSLGMGSTRTTTANAWATGNFFSVPGAVSVVGTNGASLSVTGVKLEIGGVATPYNRQSLAKSMADCQRYYSVGNGYFSGYGVATAGLGGTMFFPVTMRASPTIVPTRTNLSNIGNLNSAVLGVTSFQDAGQVVAAGGAQYYVNWTASAEL